MENIRIIYNMAMELIVSIDKFVTLSCNMANERESDAQLFEKLQSEAYIDFTPNPDLKAWNDQVNQEISPFLKNDISYLIGMRPDFMGCFSEIVVYNNLETPDQLIDHITQLPADTLIRMAFEHYHLKAKFSDDYSINFDELKVAVGVDEANLFLFLMKHPKDFKEKYLSILTAFYETHFAPWEKQVRNALESKSKLHQSILENNPTKFLTTIGLGDYSKIIDKNFDIILYLSYYTDFGISYMIENETCYIRYGLSMETRFDKEEMQLRYKNVFKALADETRREIIRLASIRPWYNKELAEHFGLTTATLSYHLNILLDLDILHFDPTDNYRYYYVTNQKQLNYLFTLMLDDLTMKK